MNKETMQAGREATVKATDFVVELCKIADKYKINRTGFIKTNAKIFLDIAMASGFENMKLTEREETNNE